MFVGGLEGGSGVLVVAFLRVLVGRNRHGPVIK